MNIQQHLAYVFIWDIHCLTHTSKNHAHHAVPAPVLLLDSPMTIYRLYDFKPKIYKTREMLISLSYLNNQNNLFSYSEKSITYLRFRKQVHVEYRIRSFPFAYDIYNVIAFVNNFNISADTRYIQVG